MQFNNLDKMQGRTIFMLVLKVILFPMHAYNRRSEVASLKLPKCSPVVESKLTSCAVVQEGAWVCLGQSDLTLVSLSAMTMNRSSGYVKDNDVRYGLMDIVTPSHQKWPAFNAAAALHLVGRRRLSWSARLQLLFKGWSHPSLPSWYYWEPSLQPTA